LALYAIGDLHLSHGIDKPMDVFGGKWVDYMDKLTQGFKVLSEDDLCVMCGDISWGISLEESLEDFRYIENLPGKKILIKGNHDYWWTTVSKMKEFFEKNELKSIDILHNNSFNYDDVAICGTRGWLSDDKLTAQQNAKITARELIRLRASLEAAKDASKILCFLHYPPRLGNIICDDVISLLNEFGVKDCYYGHLHSEGHRLATRGVHDGINYEIISADYINFTPQRVI